MPSKRYVDFGGTEFSGRDYAAVVREMKHFAWFVTSKKDYRSDVAKRVADLTGGRIQLATHSSQAFLESLVAANFLREVAVVAGAVVGQPVGSSLPATERE